MEIDWLKCELVESVEGRCGGQPTVVGTRIFPWCITANHDGGMSIAELQESYPSLSIAQIERLLEFADDHFRRVAA